MPRLLFGILRYVIPKKSPMDPVNALFWNLVLWWNYSKMPPLCSHLDSKPVYFTYRWRHRRTPRPLAFHPLNPAPSHNNNNNNGGLHACVHASTVCLYTVCKLYAHAPSPLLHFWSISSATYRPGIWTTECWVVYNGSIWTQIFLKKKKWK